MPLYEYTHVCTLEIDESYPPRYPDATYWQKFKRHVILLFVPSKRNPRCQHYLRSKESVNKERMRQLMKRGNVVFHPFSVFCMYWSFSMAIAFLLGLIIVPWEVAFCFRNQVPFSSFRSYFLLFLDCKYFVDVAVTMNTGIVRDKRVILGYAEVIRNYVLGPFFFLDVITSIPVELLASFGEFKFKNPEVTQTILLMKIYKFIPFIRCMRGIADYFEKNVKLYHLCFYHIIAALVFHWVACFQYIVPQMQVYYFSNNRWRISSWIIRSSLPVLSLATQYTMCFYRATCFLLCIGHGFYEIDTTDDAITAIVCFIIGYLMAAFFFVVIYQYLTAFRTSQLKYQIIINQVNEYMKHKKLPLDLQKRLIAFYDYKYKMRYFKETGIKEALSDRLKKEVILYSCKKLVDSVTLFAGLPENIIANIISLLKPEIFLPNDIIVKAGTSGDCIYFLSSGTVAVMTPNGKEICHLQDGAYFGEIGLIMKNQKRVATVVAIEICEAYKLDRKNFMACFSNDSEIYKEVEAVAKERLATATAMEEMHRKALIDRTKLEVEH